MNKFPAHPGLKRSKEVDSDLLERCNRLVLSEVLCPWRESCQNNQYPWEANLELRARWRELMAAPGDYTKQIAGFVGLARCTLLTAEEYRAINDFYVGSLSQQLHGNLVMNYFLSGGSPPVALLVGYYGPMLSGTGLPMLSGTGLPPPGFWHYFSRLVRHPFFAQIAEQLGAIDLPGPFMSFLTRANPAFTAPDSAVVPDNSWGRALDRFRALKELALTEPIHAF